MESLAASRCGNTRQDSVTQAPSPDPRPLIGDFIRQPAWLWFTHIVPLVVLLAWVGHVYALITDDMTHAERRISVAIGAALMAIIIGASVIAFRSQRARRLLTNAQSALLLAMSLTVLGAAVVFCWTTIPDNELEWIVNRWELLNEAFCLATPGAFHAILILTSRPLRRPAVMECSLLLLGAMLGAVLFYALAAACASIAPPLRLPDCTALTLIITGVLGGGLMITAAVARTTLIAYIRIRRMHPLCQRGFMFIVACAAPMAGLWLNQKIPFPVDLQAPVLYLLAFLNGIALLLPVVRSLFWHRTIWLAQCALFPFSAYFFVLFLPWLPLSLFAMIAGGAGFLMLVPLALGLAHAYRLADGFREEVRDGRAWPVALLGLGAVLLLPTLGLVSAWHDREALDEALTYIYSPDYRHDITFPGSLPALASALHHLRDVKQGIFLPFLTPLYNQIVFHGLVLPDAKINELQAAFFGDATAAKASVLLRSRSAEDEAWPAPPPTRDVILDRVQVTTQRNGATSTAQLLLTLRNLGAPGSEFSATVHLPDGVYVCGFSLQIGDTFVPARIVEKKTALWVYEKIAAAHSDPALLAYTSRNNLTLRISPFEAAEVRQAQLDLTYANTTPLTLTFDNANVPDPLAHQTVKFAPDPPSASPLAVTTCITNSDGIALANIADASRWQLQRTPYLDILIDCSRGTSYSTASLAHALDQAHQAFPNANTARITAINFEARDIVSDLIPLAHLDAAAICRALLPSRGGLLQDRFLKRSLLLAHDRMQTGPGQALLRPQFILISSLGQSGAREEGLDDFLRLAPDARVILTEDSEGQLNGEDLISRQPAMIENIPPVLLWRWGPHYAVSAANPHAALNFPGALNTATPQIYDPKSGQFFTTPPTSIIPSNSRFADGIRTWAAHDQAEFNPHVLNNGASELMSLSKKNGILTPDSSYIAVESKSESRAMEEKEKQKLRNNPVYEFEEPIAAPEPAPWPLLLFGLVVLGFTKSRRSHPRVRISPEPGPLCSSSQNIPAGNDE